MLLEIEALNLSLREGGRALLRGSTCRFKKAIV